MRPGDTPSLMLLVAVASCAAPAGQKNAGDTWAWATWPMPNGARDVAAGAPNPMAYAAHDDGTVTDLVTGLMWQRTVAAPLLPWAEAVGYCADLVLGGRDDWRVPGEIELVSLIEASVTRGPVSDGAAFPEMPDGYFWSSLPMADGSPNAWLVDFNSGSAYDAAVDGPEHVRCVRGGGGAGRAVDRSQQRYRVNGPTVEDPRTGLIWQRAVPPPLFGRAEARAYCASAEVIAALGGTGWRLPTGKELLTLVDYAVAPPGPTVDAQAFPETPAAFFWSSTELTVPVPAAMLVDFAHGHATNYAVGPTSAVRCVR